MEDAGVAIPQARAMTSFLPLIVGGVAHHPLLGMLRPYRVKGRCSRRGDVIRADEGATEDDGGIMDRNSKVAFRTKNQTTNDNRLPPPVDREFPAPATSEGRREPSM